MNEPNGLVAFGGDLNSSRLISAYQHGIFPWYSDDQPIMWWSPNPRMVLYPDQFKLTRSLKKNLRNKSYHVTVDTAFNQIIQACAEPRPYEKETWITQAMMEAYRKLHTLGIAHSVEVWNDDQELIGGLYGVSIGRVFCGESMFSRVSDGSKIALAALVQQCETLGITLIDCQVATEHLVRLGAKQITRTAYLEHLNSGLGHEVDWSECGLLSGDEET